jgi:hypothetical protein
MSSTTTQGGGIFTFDHGQKKLHNAIGVQESYLDDLDDQVKEVLKEYLFDEKHGMKEDGSPSELVEACANEFSYSQLVVLASFFLQHRLEDFAEKAAKMSSKMKGLALSADDVPEEFREMLDKLAKEQSEGGPISSDDIPEELRDFLIKMIKRQHDEENED